MKSRTIRQTMTLPAPPRAVTRLTMVHSDVPTSRAASLTSGWKAYYWTLLRRYLKRRSAE